MRRPAFSTFPLRASHFALLFLMAIASLPAAARAQTVKRLPNGLRYVVLEDHVSPVVSMQIHVRCGGVNEDDVTAGVSHFLEHMIFKGTSRFSAGEISRIVESNGGSINASTGMEITNYYIDIPSDRFEVAFDVLSDSVLRPAFPPEEFEKERKVILEEIRLRSDLPGFALWNALLPVVYPNTAYKQRVIGTPKTINAMTRDVMVKQHAAFYVPSNMVVVVAGDVKKSAVEKKIKAAFGKLPAGAPPRFPPLVEPPAERGVIERITGPVKQAHVGVGFVGPTLADRDQVGMDLLAATLGGGNSSRLYQQLREQKQSVWSVGSSFITHAGSGFFGVFAECPPEKARSLPNDIYLLLMEASNYGLAPEELDRAKARTRSAWLFSQETYHGQASQWGFYTALGRPELAKTYLDEAERVTVDDLRRLLRQYFQGRELSGVILTPAEPAR